MKNKKAVEIRFLVLLVLGVFIFLVLIVMIPRLLGRGDSDISDFQSESADYDSDGVVNFFDKCKCAYAETDNGCLEGIDTGKKDHCQYKGCPPGKVPSWAKTVGCP